MRCNLVNKEQIKELHDQGFNCAQTVLTACAEYTGLDRSTGLAIAGGFGGGLRAGEVCGAISGAAMALGLCCPHTTPDSPEEKARISAQAAELCKRFRVEFDCLTCRELLKKYGGKGMCVRFMEYSAELASDIIEKNK